MLSFLIASAAISGAYRVMNGSSRKLGGRISSTTARAQKMASMFLAVGMSICKSPASSSTRRKPISTWPAVSPSRYSAESRRDANSRSLSFLSIAMVIARLTTS